MRFVVLHAIVLAGKTGPTVCPGTNVLSLARVGSEMAGQVAQGGEQPATRFANVLSFAERARLLMFVSSRLNTRVCVV